MSSRKLTQTHTSSVYYFPEVFSVQKLIYRKSLYRWAKTNFSLVKDRTEQIMVKPWEIAKFSKSIENITNVPQPAIRLVTHNSECASILACSNTTNTTVVIFITDVYRCMYVCVYG